MNSIKPSIEEVLPYSSKAAIGFPSPAEDYLDSALDLNRYLVKHPVATFFVRATGESMCDAGILDGDLLIVDRSLTPQNNSIVIAIVNDELTVKRLRIIDGNAFLYPANKQYKSIAIADAEGLQFWGVVTHAIHDVRVS